MNIFSNIGITELIVILLLALIVVGPERLPEMAQKLAKALRDFRKMYENLTKDLGPELMAVQDATKEIVESVDAVRTIPKEMMQTAAKAAGLEETAEELKDIQSSLSKTAATITTAGQAVANPIGAARKAAVDALSPTRAASRTDTGEASVPEDSAPPLEKRSPSVKNDQQSPAADQAERTIGSQADGVPPDDRDRLRTESLRQFEGIDDPGLASEPHLAEPEPDQEQATGTEHENKPAKVHAADAPEEASEEVSESMSEEAVDD
jgi:sec-independent protein translocase protein TatB